MKLLQILMFAVVGCMIASCSDDNGPTVTVNITDADATYTVGDVINMTITATDDIGVASFRITNEDLGITGTETIATPDVSVTLDYSIGPLIEGTSTGDYDIEVIAVDTDGNEDSEKVSITIE